MLWRGGSLSTRRKTQRCDRSCLLYLQLFYTCKVGRKGLIAEACGADSLSPALHILNRRLTKYQETCAEVCSRMSCSCCVFD
jgi:L,D-peptidoglycan transpeptidase YkuD (ErfK/YbiS/YcfS/YnhG family)